MRLLKSKFQPFYFINLRFMSKERECLKTQVVCKRGDALMGLLRTKEPLEDDFSA